MANGMGAFYVGNAGLRSAQDAINTTANNLANVNTKGYVRQQVVFRDTEYNNLAYSKNMYKKQLGLGATIGAIQHARDVFLDKAYRQERGRQAYYDASFEAVDEVQTYFQEMEGEAFQNILIGDNSLWQSFQELYKSPSDTVNQNLVIQKAGLFASRAKAVYDGLKKYQQNINKQISEDIDTINDLAKIVYDMNIRIQSIESGKQETAMNERDTRDYAMDLLSQYGAIEYTEEIGGTVTLKFEGVLMVDDCYCYEMGKKTDRETGYITPYWPHLSNEASGKYMEVLDFTRPISTEFDTDIGELKALVQARGTTVSNFTDLLLDADKYDATTGLSIMQNTQAEFDNLVHGIVTQLNDIMVPNQKLDSLYVKNADGTTTQYSNVLVLDEDNCYVGADHKKPPQELFTRVGCERYTKVTGSLEKGGEEKTYYLYNVEDTNDSIEYKVNGKTYRVYDTVNGTMETTYDASGNVLSSAPHEPWDKEGNAKYSKKLINGVSFWVYNDDYKFDTNMQYTVSAIDINDNLKKNVTNLPYLNNKLEIDQSLAKRLGDVWDEETLIINPRYGTTYSFGAYYQEMVGEVGIVGTMYESTAETLANTVENVTNKRDGVISVSSDEELTKMIKYQNAYNAASRYIQTVSDMLESLIVGL